MIRNFLLTGAALLAVAATPAFAAMYTVDMNAAAEFRPMIWSDTTSAARNVIHYIGYSDGTDASDKIAGTDLQYYAAMTGAVGFSGNLSDLNTDGVASVSIGANQTAAGLSELAGGSLYEGVNLTIANDDQQEWEYKLYANSFSTSYETSWVSLAGGTATTLSLDFGMADQIYDLGFVVQFNQTTTGGGTNFTDDFHTSVVPVPGALLIGMLGLGSAGLRLRRYA